MALELIQDMNLQKEEENYQKNMAWLIELITQLSISGKTPNCSELLN